MKLEDIISTETDKDGAIPKIGTEQVQKFNTILVKYAAGKKSLESRVKAAEEWWRLHNKDQIEIETGAKQPGQVNPSSAWLHNVIVAKHADAIEAYPEPIFLPREESDKQEAKMLSSVVPVILEQNDFEGVYSANTWQKLKTGTEVFKIVWDKTKLNGLGDISIERVNLLSIYWEPGVNDIQKSHYLFTVDMVDKADVIAEYPFAEDKIKSSSFVKTEFLNDERVDKSDKVAKIDVYYHVNIGGKQVLQFCTYVGDCCLYASENDTEIPIDPVTGKPSGKPVCLRGWYDHGKYPFEFDPLYPIEGSPAGYGYIDICKTAQEQIDMLGKAIVDNALIASTPRFLFNENAGVNEDEFGDLTKPLVHCNGTLGEDSFRQLNTGANLSGIYVDLYNQKVEELRQTSGNTDVSTGSVSSSVTAASAIAALQEASGKTSRASTLSAYRTFAAICNQVTELIRQFYDAPRTFRIMGQRGQEQFVQYSNANLKAQPQIIAGMDMGLRLPVFDIKISAQKKNTYTKIAQNELALQFFNLGFFNPQMTDQAIMCIEMMDFDNKDEVIQKIQQNGSMYQELLLYQQLALRLAKTYEPNMVEGLSQNIMQSISQFSGQPNQPQMAAGLPQSDNISGINNEETSGVSSARERSNEATQPKESASISKGRTK